VIDFGVSRVVDNQHTMTLIGTPIWMAPEVISKTHYTEKADIYSFSLVLWSMVAGQLPYQDVNQFALAQMLTENHRPTIPPNCDPTLAKLITKGWATEFDKRPTIEVVLETLWNLKDPLTGRYYTRIHEYVSDDLFLKIISYLSERDQKSLAFSSKRFLTVLGRKLSLVPLGVSKGRSVRLVNTSLNTNRQKSHTQSLGKTQSGPSSLPNLASSSENNNNRNLRTPRSLRIDGDILEKS